MMTERKQKYVDRITASRERIIGLFEQIGDRSEEQLYSDGAGWTLRQLVIHLMISDKGISSVIQRIALGENPISPDYDVDRYNKRSVDKQPDLTIEQAIKDLRQTRAEFLQWLDSADDSFLDKEGFHPLHETYKLSQFLNIMASHDNQHADDIEKLLNQKH